MSLFITQLHFRPFPTPDFIKRPVVFAAHFLVLVIKAVGKPRFSSPDIDGLCGVKIIKLAFIKLVALTVGDKFLFLAFLLYLLYGKEQRFVPVVNGNVQPCEVIIACPVSAFTAFKHIPKGQAVVIEDTENIITPSAYHHEITAKPLWVVLGLFCVPRYINVPDFPTCLIRLEFDCCGIDIKNICRQA